MSLTPGRTVTEISPELQNEQKTSVQRQLSEMLIKLRSLPPFDSVAGEGCKDMSGQIIVVAVSSIGNTVGSMPNISSALRRRKI